MMTKNNKKRYLVDKSGIGYSVHEDICSKHGISNDLGFEEAKEFALSLQRELILQMGLRRETLLKITENNLGNWNKC